MRLCTCNMFQSEISTRSRDWRMGRGCKYIHWPMPPIDEKGYDYVATRVAWMYWMGEQSEFPLLSWGSLNRFWCGTEANNADWLHCIDCPLSLGCWIFDEISSICQTTRAQHYRVFEMDSNQSPFSPGWKQDFIRNKEQSIRTLNEFFYASTSTEGTRGGCSFGIVGGGQYIKLGERQSKFQITE